MAKGIYGQVTWLKDSEGVILGAEIEGFNREAVRAGIELATLEHNARYGDDRSSRKYDYNKCSAVIENKAQSRLAIWCNGQVSLHRVGESLYDYIDVGRIIFGGSTCFFVYQSLAYSPEDLERIGDLAGKVYLSFKERALVISCRHNIIEEDELYLVTPEILDENVAVTVEVATRIVEREKEEVRHAQEKEALQEEIAKDADEIRKEIGENWGRGRIGGIKYKAGRMYKKDTGEYLIAPGLNFGSRGWVNYRSTYYRNSTPDHGEISTEPKKVIRDLAHCWASNVEGSYKNDAVTRQYIAWLEGNPHLKIGFRHKGRMVERELNFGVRYINPDTGETYTHPHYMMNGHRVPKSRIHVALGYWTDPEIEESEFLGFLKHMGKYTKDMLNLPGKEKTMSVAMPSLSGRSEYEDFSFKFIHRLDEDVWRITCDDLLSIERDVTHDQVRKFIGRVGSYYNRGLTYCLETVGNIGVDKEEFMQALKVRAYRREMSEKKSEELLQELADAFPAISYNKKAQIVTVQGKMRRYRIVVGDSQNGGRVTVYNDETNSYICIDDSGSLASQIKYDKVAARALALMNDEAAQEFISTIRDR